MLPAVKTRLCFLLLATAGCLEPGPSSRPDGSTAIDASRADAGGRDAGSTDAGELGDGGETLDGGEAIDGGATLDGGADATSPDAGGMTDAGMAAIAIDGVLASGEWSAATSATTSVASDWGPGVNELRSLYLLVDGTYVYIAVEGAVEAMNGIVVYVDGMDGAGVCDLSTLTDSTGAVDDRLSAGFITPASFCADAGWSTRYFDRSAGADDPDMGWRDIDTGDPADFAWVPLADAPTVCSATVCETRVPRLTVGALAGETVSVFARLGNQSGTDWSNQTLPEDAASTPQNVSVFLEQIAP